MTAIIIELAEWRAARARFLGVRSQLPKADAVAGEYIDWLREQHPGIAPQTAAAMIGERAWTWARVRRLYARAWTSLPLTVRRGGNT